MLAVIHKVCKNHKRYKIKELLFKTFGKCQIKTTRRAKVEFALFNYTREMGMDDFFFFNFNFLTKLQKNICYARTLTAEPPTLSYELVRF